MGRAKKQNNLSKGSAEKQAEGTAQSAPIEPESHAPDFDSQSTTLLSKNAEVVANQAQALDDTVEIKADQPPMILESKADALVESVIDGRYQVLSILGKGGMGTVYLAKHLVLNRIRAVKVLHAHLLTDSHAIIRFRNEAAAVSALEHANIISVHDSGTNESGTPYIAMDFVEGISLAQLIQDEGALLVARALPIFRQVAEALSHAHGKGIVHRDLKPSNIMLVNSPDRKDFVKVLDFGIAKILPQEGIDTQKLTKTGDVFGSPLYMSPEQCMGGKLDERSDIYSLGCLMHESLTGTPPFVGNTAYETFLKHMNEPPPGLKGFVKDRSTRESLEVILLAALAKEPEKRYQSMRRLADHLKLVEQGMHRGALARAKNWWYLRQLKRGPQRKVIPFGRFVAVMTFALCLSFSIVFLALDLSRTEPVDYNQTLLWSGIRPQPIIKKATAEIDAKLDRAKQFDLMYLNLPGGDRGARKNTLALAYNLMKFGRFREAIPFFRTVLDADIAEARGRKPYPLAAIYHSYGDALLYSNDIGKAEQAYLDEIGILDTIYSGSPALFPPLVKLAAIHAEQRRWRRFTEDYTRISQLKRKRNTDTMSRFDTSFNEQGLSPIDLCRLGDALIHRAVESSTEEEQRDFYKQAQSQFTECLGILEQSGSALAQDNYVANVGMAKYKSFWGENELAEQYFRAGIKKLENLNKGDIPLAIVFTNYADFCRQHGNYFDWVVWRTKAAFERIFERK